MYPNAHVFISLDIRDEFTDIKAGSFSWLKNGPRPLGPSVSGNRMAGGQWFAGLTIWASI